MKQFIHIPILKTTIVNFWKNQGSGIFVDCTFGRGGHSRALLDQIDKKSQLIALDIDDAAISVGKELAAIDSRFVIVNSNFIFLKEVLAKQGIQGVDGILFDFGVSSPQLDDPIRGFSYHHNGPLDMRMDLSIPQTVADILANVSVSQLAKIFKLYGECDQSRKVAQAIIKHQEHTPITTTMQLVEVIKKAVSVRKLYEKKHPCRKYFQALRIYVNKELENIDLVLKQLFEVLNINGIVVFLTFHSLEEKIIKKWIQANTGYIDLPNVPINVKNKFELLTKKSITPTESEIINNNRARSSKLWVVRKN